MLQVTKRNGSQEPIQLDKIHRVLEWAAEDLHKVSVSEVELRAQVQFTDGIKTSDIHKMLIKAAADLISERTPDYQWMAARLKMFHMRKEAFGQFEPPHFADHVTTMVLKGLYDRELVAKYSWKELSEMDTWIDHSRDMSFSYVATVQLREKYLVQNRVTGELFESPQLAYMAIAAALHAEEPKKKRMARIRRFYDAVSNQKLSLPTPIMAGVRTPTRQFSSCVLIEAGDSLDEINAAASAIVKYISQRAGIGINFGSLRGMGAEIRNGEAYHTGMIPFIKHMQTAVKSCSQGGVRGGSATMFFPLWTWEIESLLVLKNNRGTEDNRARQLDYGVQLNKTMYQRLQTGGNITLFSMEQVPDLLAAFYADQDEFERLYVHYENDPDVRKKSVPAVELFGLLGGERTQTGRIYIQNIDHCNTHSAFNPKVAPVKQSNLCMEITLPTAPMEDIKDPTGEIALCTLLAVNVGALEDLDELEELMDVGVRALDNLLSYQDYPVYAARKALLRRSLGIGVTNFAYYLAKNGASYEGNERDLQVTHDLFESIQYYALLASNRMAAEKGACGAFGDTTYAQGILPIDTYRPKVDDIVSPNLRLDWEGLRKSILDFGLRNSTLTALMPCETSSQITNSTNGIEPPRGLISVKSSKEGVVKQVVPDIELLKNRYSLLWDLPSNRGYLKHVAVMQKFVDQSISTNTNYDPRRFDGGKIPMRQVIEDMMYAYSLGIKTLYYSNTRDGAGESVDEGDCDNCKV